VALGGCRRQSRRTVLPMKVTYLLSDLGGGTGHHLLDLLRVRDPGHWWADIVSEVPSTSRMELPVGHVVLEDPPGPASYPVRQVQRYRQVETVFRNSRPDILHTYFFWSIIYGRILKARGIVSRLVENREDLGFAWGTHEYSILALTRNLPDRVICVSDAVRRIVLEREGLGGSRVCVIHNGITQEEPTGDPHVEELRAELGFSPEDLVVGMVANYDRPVKGVDVFLESIPLIRAAVPQARFILLGQGTTERRVRSRAANLGIDDVFLMPGFREDVSRFYALMDVSVLTSFSEGLSITVLESMRHGVPVVATAVGGNPEIVSQGRTGFLVPPGDPAAFAATVVKVLRDRNLRQRLGNSAKLALEGGFDLAEVSRRYYQTYRQVLEV
jgi:glycosyltransferase involved in cell wall biosynthesis